MGNAGEYERVDGLRGEVDDLSSEIRAPERHYPRTFARVSSNDSFFEVIPVDPVFEDATLAGVSANLLPCVRWHGVVRSTIRGCTPRTVSGLAGAGCIGAFE